MKSSLTCTVFFFTATFFLLSHRASGVQPAKSGRPLQAQGGQRRAGGVPAGSETSEHGKIREPDQIYHPVYLPSSNSNFKTLNWLCFTVAGEKATCAGHVGQLVWCQRPGGTDLWSIDTFERYKLDLFVIGCDISGVSLQHLSAEELARRREEMKKQPKPNKTARFKGWVITDQCTVPFTIVSHPALALTILTLYSSSLDPFQLIPCRSFGEDVQVCRHIHFISRFLSCGYPN